MSKPLPPPRTSRISAKVRAAVELRVRKGLSVAAAAQEVGLSKNGLGKALKRPAVDQLVSEMQTRFVAEVDARRALLRARALQVAADMLDETKDERTKLKLIEMLMSDGKGPAVSVNVDARAAPSGYEFVPPGTRVQIIDG